MTEVEIITGSKLDPKEFSSLDSREVYEMAIRAGMEAQSVKDQVSALVVGTREEADRMDRLRSEIQTQIRKTDKIKTWFTEDAKRHVTKVNGFFAVIAAPLKDAKVISGQKLVAYQEEVERQEREEAAKQAAKEAQARKDSVETLNRLAEQAEESGKTASAELLKGRAAEAEAVAVSEMLPKETAPKKLTGTHFRKTWYAGIRIGDEEEQMKLLARAINEWNAREDDKANKDQSEPRVIIPGVYWALNMTALDKLAQATSGTAHVPGVEFKEKTTPVTRGR